MTIYRKVGSVDVYEQFSPGGSDDDFNVIVGGAIALGVILTIWSLFGGF